MNIIYLRGGKNCGTKEAPYSYQTYKEWHRKGKFPEAIFKITPRSLVLDCDAWDQIVERRRAENIKAARKKRMAAEVNR